MCLQIEATNSMHSLSNVAAVPTYRFFANYQIYLSNYSKYYFTFILFAFCISRSLWEKNNSMKWKTWKVLMLDKIFQTRIWHKFTQMQKWNNAKMVFISKVLHQLYSELQTTPH